MSDHLNREALVAQYSYPSGATRMACPPDNDGAPTCMGDTGYCGYSKELDKQVCVNLTPRTAP